MFSENPPFLSVSSRAVNTHLPAQRSQVQTCFGLLINNIVIIYILCTQYFRLLNLLLVPVSRTNFRITYLYDLHF